MDFLQAILAKFTVDTSDVTKGLKSADTKVSGFEATLKKLGGVVAGAFAGKAILNFASDLIHTADATAKTADALGMGIVELQEWQHAADLSGVQSEMLTASLGKLNLQLNEAATKGTGPAAESLKALGLEAENADGKLKSSGQIIEEVADAIQGMDTVERNAQLMKLFGEQGAKLVPLLKGGSKGIKAMRGEVEALGFAFDEDFARNAEAFDDNVDRLKKGFTGLVIQGLGPMLPDLIELSGHLVKGAKAVIPYVKGFVQFLKHSKLLQAGLALLGVKGFAMVAKFAGGFLTKMGGLRGVFLRILPILLKVIAPLLILEDLFVFFAGGKSAFGELLDKAFGKGTGDKVRQLGKDVVEFIKMFVTAPDKVRDAFSQLPKDLEKILGPFGDFVGKLGQNLVEYFLFATNAMTGGWDNFVNKAIAVGEWLLASLNIVWTETKFAVLALTAGIMDAFTGAWNSVIQGAQNALKAVSSVLDKIPLLGGAADAVANAGNDLEALKGDDQKGEVISAEWDNARAAIVADIEAATARANGQPSQTASPTASQVSNTSVQQDVSNTTQVNVTVPEGTSAGMARRVGSAAAEGASQGSRSNLRATQAALVPQPT